MKKFALLVLLGSTALSAQSADTSHVEKRAAFLKMIDRPRVELQPEVRPITGNRLRVVEEHISFSVDTAQRVTGLLMKSPESSGRLPVVIQLHGTGGNKEQLRTGNAPGLNTPYATAIFNAYKTGREHPFFYDTVLDVMRLIDYLETRRDVDPSRIGLGGFSKGGIETYLTAAVEPRVAAAVRRPRRPELRLGAGPWRVGLACMDDPRRARGDG
jgi:cephalosporin-C deacetylase-like acetyl esterase